METPSKNGRFGNFAPFLRKIAEVWKALAMGGRTKPTTKSRPIEPGVDALDAGINGRRGLIHFRSIPLGGSKPEPDR